jgi:hypothetical protein
LPGNSANSCNTLLNKRFQLANVRCISTTTSTDDADNC